VRALSKDDGSLMAVGVASTATSCAGAGYPGRTWVLKCGRYEILESTTHSFYHREERVGER